MKTNEKKNTLDKYCINLTAEVKNGARLDQTRPEIVEKMGQIMSRNRRNSLCINGPAYSGLTVLLNSLIKDVSEEKYPKLVGKTFFKVKPELIPIAPSQSITAARLVDAMAKPNKCIKRLNDICEHLRDVNGIAVVDISEAILGGNDQRGIDQTLVNLFVKLCEKNSVQYVLISHSKGNELQNEHDMLLELLKKDKTEDKSVAGGTVSDNAQFRSLTRLNITEQPLTVELAKVLLGERKPELTFADKVIEEVIDIAKKISRDKSIINTALDFFDILESELKKLPSKITAKDAKDMRKKYYGEENLAILDLKPSDKENEPLDFEKAKANLKSRVIGQDNVIDHIVKAIEIGTSPLRNKLKPVHSTLFAGSTGTGKTFLSKNIAAEFKFAFLHIDVSKYKTYPIEALLGGEKHDGGEIGNHLDNNPNGSVILFDEIDKIDREGGNPILDLLLPAIDEGRLALGNGESKDVSKCIFIFTSNHAADSFSNSNIGFGNSEIITDFSDFTLDKKVKVLSPFLRKEFLNRLDDIVIFNKIQEHTLKKIVKNRIDMINEELAPFEAEILLSSDAEDALANQGYSSELGVRPLDKVIDEKLRLPLAKMFHKGELSGEKVRVDFKKGKFEFKG